MIELMYHEPVDPAVACRVVDCGQTAAVSANVSCGGCGRSMAALCAHHFDVAGSGWLACQRCGVTA